MSWRDAPIIDPATAPAWARAPVAEPTPAPAGGAVPEDPRDDGGFLSKVGGYIERIDKIGGNAVNRIAGGFGRAIEAAGDFTGIDAVEEFGRREGEIGERNSQRAVEGVTSWDQVKANPSIGNVGSFALEQGLGSIPDMAVAVGALPAYVISRAGEMGQQRAENNGDGSIGILDMLKAAPAAVGSAALERYGFRGIGDVAGNVVAGAGKAGLKEGGTEFGQGLIEHAGTNLGTDVGIQPAEALDNALAGVVAGTPFGAGANLGVRGVSSLRNLYSSRGVDTSSLSDDELVEGSLNGGIHPDVGAKDVDTILRSVGADPSQFSSPDVAAAAAERAAAAMQRPNINDLGPVELGRQEGIADDIAAGETDPAWAQAPPARTVPDDIVITAAPEGLMRSDDVGSLAGVERHRGATDNILGVGREQAENDPVLHEILASELEPNAKVGAIIKRLRDTIAAMPAEEPHPAFPDAPELPDFTAPFTAPTADQARTAPVIPSRGPAGVPKDIVDFFRIRGMSEGQARGIAAGIVAESRGDHTISNPTSGAFGLGQWLGPRKKELFRRYGENPTRAQQLEFLHWELTGGDHGGKKVLSQSEASNVMASYIRDFMRPAAGAETSGDLSRGLAALGAKDDGTIYRAPEPRDDPFRSDSGFERTDAPYQPTQDELEQPGATYDRMATGDSSAPFMESTDDPADGPSWERRAEMHAEELRQEWENSRQKSGPASEDPSQKYGKNAYGQRPHQPKGSPFWATTDDGHVADVNGKPVAFRNIKDAAKWAAKNKMGGDFEPVVWATNSARVTLRKRPNSTYGTAAPRPEGPAEPAAGRSSDASQRAIPQWKTAPPADGNGAPASDTGPAGPIGPETGSARPAGSEAPLRAVGGYVSDRDVPRGTDDIPAGPERIDATPLPDGPGEFFPGTFERDRPDADIGRQPPQPRNFARAVQDYFRGKTAKSGLRQRFSAEDAVQHGVPADLIYVNPKAKYPVIKRQFAGIFTTTKAPLNSKAQPSKAWSLDHVGDVFNYDDFGVYPEGGGRAEPAEIAELLTRALERHESAFDRTDPRYDEYNTWVQRSHDVDEFAARYGDDWQNMSDEELDAIDADLPLDDMIDHVLSDTVPEAPDGRFEEAEASVASRPGEDAASGGQPESDARAPGDGEAAAGDALFAERETDQRDAAQRRADAGLKPDKEQKAPGSDGGLFDTRDTTGDFVDDKPPKRGVGGAFKDLLSDEGGSLNADAVRNLLFEKDASPADVTAKLRELVSSPAKTTKGLLRALDRFGSAVAYSSDGALRTLARHYNSPTIVKLANLFQARAGAPDATARTYDEALKRSNGRFRSRLDETLDPFMGDKPALERIRDLLADPNRSVKATAKEREAARSVRVLLKDVHEYRMEAGEDLGEVKNYFPRVIDTIGVANQPGKFKKAAERLYRDVGVDDPPTAADAWLQRILDTHAGLDGGEEFIVSSGKPSSSKSREFGPKADRLLRDFMQKDPLLVLSDYVTGSVRRAEQVRRFGAKGAVNSKERADWMKQHGDKTQWDVMLDDVRAELHASSEDADGVVRQLKIIRDGSLGRLGTSGVRLSRAVSTIHAWNQISTLQKVTLSSVGDLAMGFVRGGPSYGVKHFTTSLKEAARLVEVFGKKDLSDAHRWAEAMGTVGHGTASQLIQARMDAAPGAVKHAALLNKFYHKVGIEQLTQGGRIAATQSGKVFLDTLAGDLLSKSARTRSRATLYMKELGITDPQAFGEWLRKGAPSDKDLAADRGFAADYATAVVRFADQTILMPSRAHKPAWANHPVGSLVFALQSYSAAFTQNVLKRVGRLGVEGVKSKDPALLIPASGLVVLLGLNALQLYLRTAIFGGEAPDDAEEFALHAIERAGFTGMASPFVNALIGVKYRRPISQSLQGSVIGRVGQAADAAGGLAIGNSKNTNSAERKAAGLVYDLVIDPATNAFGAKYLRGPAGTAAIMGTGNKKGGVLPGDRDAFVDAIAGEKKRVSSEK